MKSFLDAVSNWQYKKNLDGKSFRFLFLSFSLGISYSCDLRGLMGGAREKRKEGAFNAHQGWLMDGIGRLNWVGW